MDNLELYNTVRVVPGSAKKTIKGGRLSGYTDINPMWRIKTLTEKFGLVGIGWRYEILDKRLETGGNGEIAAFIDINLYIKINENWSEPIVGTGGSMFVTKEAKGLYTNDECFKMALTDAISVACKSLGIGADVYWEKDRTKYDGNVQAKNNKNEQPAKNTISQEQVKYIYQIALEKGFEEATVNKHVLLKFKKKTYELTSNEFEQIIEGYQKSE